MIRGLMGILGGGVRIWGLGSDLGRSPRLGGDFRRRGADFGAWGLIWGDDPQPGGDYRRQKVCL